MSGTFGDGFEGHYPASADCSWVIEAADGSPVVLEVFELDMKPGDYVYVKEHHDDEDSGVVLASLTGTTAPAYTIVATGGHMEVEFFTDDADDSAIVSTGFQARYQVVRHLIIHHYYFFGAVAYLYSIYLSCSHAKKLGSTAQTPRLYQQ